MRPVLLLLVLTVARPISAQSASVRGTVIDAATRAPIADAEVTLVEPGRRMRTAADGVFVFDGIAPGEYTLTVTRIGYIFIRRRVTLTTGGAAPLVIPIASGTDAYTESVEVTAAAAPAPGISVTQLNSAALQDLRDIAADDPVRALQGLPGVATGNDFQAEFSVRGSAFRQVGIVIDGVPTSLLFHTVRGTENTGSIAMLNTDVLAGASLSAGTRPQEDGEWLGATVAFDLRDGSRDRTGVRSTISGTSASVVAEGPIGRSKRGSWLSSVRKSYIDWLVRKIEPSIDSTIGFTDTQHKLVYDLTARQQVQLAVVGGRALYQKPTATSANEIAQATSASILSTAAWRYTRDHLRLTERVSLVTNTFHDRGTAGQQESNGRTHVWLWRSDLALFLTPAWTIDGGLRAAHERLDQTLNIFVVRQGRLATLQQMTYGSGRNSGGGWAELTRRTPAGGLTVGVDAAAAGGGPSLVSPWLLADRRLGPLHVFGGIGQSAQRPSLEEASEAPDPLRPEHATTFDAGLEQPLTPTVAWRLAGFRRTESDVERRVGEDRLQDMTRIIGSPFLLVASRLDGTSNGIEATVERRSVEGFTGWVGYTWAHTRYRDRVTGEAFDGDFDQRHTLNVFVQHRLSYRMKASAKLRVGSNFPIVGYFAGTPQALTLASVRNAVRLPVYARLDLSGSRTFTVGRSRLTAFVEIVNALARRNFGVSDGSIRSNLTAVGFVDRLLPLVPSAGLLMEF
jgi:hypothetical protein